MLFNLEIIHILVISFLFLTTLNCLVTYLCSSSSLKTLEKSKSYDKAINKILNYDKYILTSLTLLTSLVYVILFYFYFVDLLGVSDYFITLSVVGGFLFSLLTTFFSRLCYCYACNVLLETKLNEYECFIENFFYLVRIFFPLFLISFAIPTIYLLPVSDLVRRVIVSVFIFIYLILWVVLSPYKTIFTLSAKKIKGEELNNILSSLFLDNDIKRYKLYYWDSSRSNESNALISGFFTYHLFLSSSLIDSLTISELEAVVLHEIGHIKNHHFTKILISKLILLIFLSVILFYSLFIININIWILFALILGFVFVMGMNLKGSKKYEDEADMYVNKKGYGNELISALKKTSKGDASYNKLDDFFSSHPNVNKRIGNLGTKNK